MGIKDLTPFLKDKCPHYKQENISMEILRGKRIAIDVGIYIHKYGFVIHKDLLFKHNDITTEYDHNMFTTQLMINFLTLTLNWLNKGVTPIYVFDGSINPVKAECVKSRTQIKNDNREKVNVLIEKYNNMFPLERTNQHIQEILNVKSKISALKSIDFETLKDLFDQIGIINITAKHDSEKLCSALNREGLVDAVLTIDTDVLPLGTSYAITDYNFSNNTFEMINLESVIQYFKTEFPFDDEQVFYIFVDFCIMCGSDFSVRIPGVGPAGILKKLKKYGSIEGVAQEHDITCLNHILARQSFQYENSKIFNDQLKLNWNKFNENINRIIDCFGCHNLKNIVFSIQMN